jgi:hypothetical protein
MKIYTRPSTLHESRSIVILNVRTHRSIKTFVLVSHQKESAKKQILYMKTELPHF